MNSTHGESKRNNRTHLWRSWYSMKSRCKHDPNYAQITYCKEWEKFEAFRDWAHTNEYQEGLSLNRINNDIGYKPSNCQWIQIDEQNANRRFNMMITYNNETLCVAQWEKKMNLPIHFLRQRIKRGWSIEEAFNTPANTWLKTDNIGLNKKGKCSK